MFEQIKKCQNCNLCKNQKPLLDSCETCDVMWVGLSAKLVGNVESVGPLDEGTQSGKVISEIESMKDNVCYYKTNVVKCAPLDKEGKLRYPNRKEMDECIENLELEIEQLTPKVVFLLGEKVKKSIERKYKIAFEKKKQFEYQGIEKNNVHFFAIEHPSYMSIYKRKYMEDYKRAIIESIESVI